MWYWQRDRHIEHWNRTENPEADPDISAQLIFSKMRKQNNGERITFLSNGAGAIGHSQY